MPRLSLKPDASFFRFIALGAIGARAVIDDLGTQGHRIEELESGAIDTKLWKEVKRKRVRIPDLVCTWCGLRVESRAKSSASISVSHSSTDAERAWDYGMIDRDVIAFPVGKATPIIDQQLGDLKGHVTYWRSRERTRWKMLEAINYVSVGELRSKVHIRESTKGVVEGSETSIEWGAIFSTRAGSVTSVESPRITVRRDRDGHSYTWRNTRQYPTRVSKGNTVRHNQILASEVEPLDGKLLSCPGELPQGGLSQLFASPERTQRFTGLKIARLRQDLSFEDRAVTLLRHPDEDLYVRLEAATYLTSVCGHSLNLFDPFFEGADPQNRLEAVISVSEVRNDTSVDILGRILHDESEEYFLRSAAAWALGRVGSRRSTDLLVQGFVALDPRVKEEALSGLAGMGEVDIEVLVDALGSNHIGVAAGAAEVLRRQEALPDAALQAIGAYLSNDPAPLWAVWLLGHVDGTGEPVSAMKRELEKTNPSALFAVSVLEAFVKSWIAPSWELNPCA